MRGWENSTRLRVSHYCQRLIPSTNVEVLDLLYKHNFLGHAADYYAKAKLYTEAAECYHSNGQNERAATVLRQGGHFDELVAYIRVYVTIFLTHLLSKLM